MIERLAERSPLCPLLGPSEPRPWLRTKPGSTPPATTCRSSPGAVGHWPADLTAGLQEPRVPAALKPTDKGSPASPQVIFSVFSRSLTSMYLPFS